MKSTETNGIAIVAVLLTAAIVAANDGGWLMTVAACAAMFAIASTAFFHNVTMVLITLIRESSSVLMVWMKTRAQMYGEHQRTEREKAKGMAKVGNERARQEGILLRHQQRIAQAQLKADKKLLAQQDIFEIPFDVDIDGEYEVIER